MKKYQHLRYQTFITGTIIKYISMKFAVDVAIIDMLAFAHGQA
jgi:hypothetical protein